MSTAAEQETNQDYHTDSDHIGKSMLDVFRQSRRKYYERFVAKTMPAPEPTPQMLLGTLVHLAVLQPDSLEESIIVCPKLDRRTKAGKQQWQEFLDDAEGRQVVDADTHAQVLAIRDAVFANATARKLLAREGEIEQPHRWKDSQSGLLLKCRPDLATDAYLLDLKTCHAVDPEGFARSATNLGYFRQHEHYQRGWQDKTGQLLPFVFLAVCTAPPYECGFYELNREAVTLGENQNRSAMQQLAACYRNEMWDSPFSTRITTLGLPRWSVYSSEWEIFA